MGGLFSTGSHEPRRYRKLPQTAPQRIVHISGSPGSGKTFLLKQLERKLPTTVELVDTDTLIVPIFESKAWGAFKTDAERGRYYAREATRRITAYIDSKADATGIVLAGLTMYWAWSPETGGIGNGRAYPATIRGTHSVRRLALFIDIETDTLIRQRYTRDVVQAVETKEEEILSGELNLDFSANNIRDYARVERSTFVEDLGYTLETQSAIIDRVIEFLGQ